VHSEDAILSEGRPLKTPELVGILDINTRAPQAPRCYVIVSDLIHAG
jgi:hypothetical protein